MSIKLPPLLFVGLVFGLASSSFSRDALAQEPSAVDLAQGRELLNLGLDLREKGDAEGALPKLKAAHSLVHSPITGLELGRTFMATGKLVEARESFLSVARLPVLAEETKRSKVAREQSELLAEQLRARIPSLTVKVTGVAAASVAVTIDGAALPTEALDAPRLVDPGGHDISARSTSGGTANTHVDLGEGETRDVELKIVFTSAAHPAPPVAPAPTRVEAAQVGAAQDDRPLLAVPATSEPAQSQVAAWVLLGGGAAVAVAGVVFMGVEANAAADANARQDPSDYDHAKTGWTLGLVGTVAGGAAVAAGAIKLAISSAKGSPTGTRASLWLEPRMDQIRFGGTW